MKVLSLILSLSFCISCTCNLEKWARNSDLEKITIWRAKQKYDWTRNWHLDSCFARQIDHYLEGVDLYWSIKEDTISLERRESFNLDGTFYTGSEYKVTNDTSHVITYIKFRPDKSLYYKKKAFWDGEFSSSKRKFILDIYSQNKIISSYSSRSYHIDLYDFDLSLIHI